MERLEQRWNRRAEDVEDVVITVELEIPAGHERIWPYLVTPSALPLLDLKISEALELPSPTTQPARRRWCVITDVEGVKSAYVVELLSLTPHREVLFRWETGSFPAIDKTVLEPTDIGTTRVINQTAIRVPDGAGSDLRKSLEPEMVAFLRRLRSVVASGVTLPTPSEDEALGTGSQAG